MRFTPKTQEEIDLENIIPDGEYDFEVIKAEEAVSKSGNDMLELTLKVYLPDGSERQIKDYLLEKFAHKLRRFCQVSGLIDIYQRGELTAADVERVSGRCKVAVQQARTVEGKDYRASNQVKDYLDKSPGNGHSRPVVAPKPVGAIDPTEELPF